ncbi:hypothetical protein QQ045_011244 [Rhodiola kirilowii]
MDGERADAVRRKLEFLYGFTVGNRGDFNEILFGWEMMGRRLRKEWQMHSFREAVQEYGLVDLGYSGITYTFSNRRASQFETRARLDRVFANLRWKDLFNRYGVEHLRKKKNTVTKIKGPNDRWITEDKEIGDEVIHHFESIFKSTSHKDNVECEENLSFICNSVSAEKIEFLCAPFTEIEIQNAVYQLGSTKAPGPNGFSALFYQEYWCVVKHEVIKFSLNFLNEGSRLGRGMNDTLITLIPKKKSPITFNEFRPIRLCIVAMKIITKDLANRLKEVLNDCISASQSAFIPGRLITDNILIAHELINYIRTKTQGSVGY